MKGKKKGIEVFVWIIQITHNINLHMCDIINLHLVTKYAYVTLCLN